MVADRFCFWKHNYSKVILKDSRHFLILKTLKDVQEVLEETHFLRVHRQYIINLNYVKPQPQRRDSHDGKW
jgi:two-component system LytT family response regulator